MKKRILCFFSIAVLIFCTLPLSAGAVGDVIDFTRDSLDLYVDESYQLRMQNDSPVTDFTSSDKDIVSVDGDGKVKALSSGVSIITATDARGNQASCTVNVKKGTAPTGIVISKKELYLIEGESGEIKAKVQPENQDQSQIHFLSSDESVARVDEKGSVQALKEGTAVITAEGSTAAVFAECQVTVAPRSSRGVFSVNVSGVLYSVAGDKKANMVLELKNEKESLEATTDTNGQFEFEGVIQGDYDMLVFRNSREKTPVSTGKFTVGSHDMKLTCIMNDKELSILYQKETEATAELRDVSLEKSTLTIEVNSSYDMTFKVSPSDAVLPTMTGKSDNENIAAVDIDGRITGISEGTANITFTTSDKRISKTCKVTVVSQTRNTYSWIIIFIESAIIIALFISFTVTYRRFIRNKEREEGVLPPKKKKGRYKK